VAFNYAGINSGKPSASGQLFLDGIQRAEFSQSHQVFRWEVQGSVLILGINFVGLFDELAVFDRTLTAVEVMHLYHAQGDWESSE
jgi:hypothetical protein